MTWTTGGYHKIIMVDLLQLSEAVGGFSENMDAAQQRHQFQEILRFAHKIEETAKYALGLLLENNAAK